MTLMIECRPARSDELDAVAQVWRESAAKGNGVSPGVVPLTEFHARLEDELKNSWTLTIALIDDQVVGLLALKLTENVLDQIFVSPPAQRQGVGSILLKQAMDAMPSGFTLTTASTNAGARCFYERMGMRLVSESRHPRQGYPICFYAWDPHWNFEAAGAN